MKIGILTCAFNEPNFIIPCIKQFEGFNFPHLILVSSKPWNGDYIMDNTWALAKMHNKYGHVEIDKWPNQAEQLNWGLDIFEKENYDWVLIVDTDEFYTAFNIGALVGQLRNTKVDIIRTPNMFVYWKTPENLIVPAQTDNPVIAVKPYVRFGGKHRLPTVDLQTDIELFTGEIHHMSYVRTDEEMKKKIETFGHTNEFNTNEWYKNVWLKWEPKMENLHPVVPKQFKRTINEPAPKEIRRLINWGS